MGGCPILATFLFLSQGWDSTNARAPSIALFAMDGKQEQSHSIPPQTKTPETEVSGVLLWQTRRLLRPRIVPIQPCDQAPSLLATCFFRPCRRWIFELPRTSHPLAPPAVKLRVAPEPAPPITPSDEVPGCPASCIFRPCRRWVFESPRISHPSAASALKLRVAPSLRSSSAAFR